MLVVGIDSLMTQLAKCCKPAPPDAISGFVTRGKGVSIHRSDCSNFRELAARSAERVIEVEWGAAPSRDGAAVYPVDVAVEAADRQGLLRDISEVFAKEKMNVIGVQTQSVKGTAWMTFTVEVADSGRLNKVLGHGGGSAGRALGQAPLAASAASPAPERPRQACYNRALEDEFRRVAQLVRAPP